MTSFNFNFTEPTASNEDSTGITHKEISSIKKFDVIMIKERPSQVVEMTYTSLGKGKYFILGVDIFTGGHYEDVYSSGSMVQVPHLSKKEYLVVSIDDDGYVTLLDEDTCNTRSDLKLRNKSDLGQQLLDKYNEGSDQIKVTVIKALGEEQIMEFKVID